MSACMSRELFGRIMSRTEGTAGAVQSEKRASLTKEAKNLGRLLARVGQNLAGATARDLKFLRRRGLRGFTPQQVSMLRSRGMLPSVERELSGFDKGTENMLHWTPKAPPGVQNATYAQPIRQIKRTNVADEFGPPAYSSNVYTRDVTIPDTSPQATAGLSLADREMLSSIARHEAREWVRGNAAMAAGRYAPLPGHQGDITDIFSVPELGTSHMPGVIHDERVFRSGLSNRLGLGTQWDRLPLGDGIVRGPRDAYVGSKPLPYEFNLIRNWHRLLAAQRAGLRKYNIGPTYESLGNPELAGRFRRISDAAYSKYKSLIPPDISREIDALRAAEAANGARLRFESLPDEIAELTSGKGMFRWMSPGKRASRLERLQADLARYNANPPRQLTQREQSLIRNRSRLEPYMMTSDDMFRALVNRHLTRGNGEYRGYHIPFADAIEPYESAMFHVGSNAASRATGIPREALHGVIDSRKAYLAPGSELAYVNSLGVYPSRLNGG